VIFNSTAVGVCLALGACLLGASPACAGQASQPKRKAASQARAACQDSEGGLYSEGAIVKVHGQQMQCVVGPHWEPLEPGSSAPKASELDVTGENVLAEEEAAILKALGGPSLPALHCDRVLNSELQPAQLLQVPPGHKLLLVFWSPTCGPCKPLLAKLAGLPKSKPNNLAVVGVVQAADPEFDPPGEWRLQRVKELMAQYKVGFPTCVHASKELARRWQATGVPLTLLITEKGVERVAGGGKNGQQLVEEVVGRAGGSH
jgi:thiol-disulfide isomerase/thioredoxin